MVVIGLGAADHGRRASDYAVGRPVIAAWPRVEDIMR